MDASEKIKVVQEISNSLSGLLLLCVAERDSNTILDVLFKELLPCMCLFASSFTYDKDGQLRNKLIDDINHLLAQGYWTQLMEYDKKSGKHLN